MVYCRGGSGADRPSVRGWTPVHTVASSEADTTCSLSGEKRATCTGR